MLCEINYGKYLRGETRSFCINCLNVSDITHEQTNSFLCTTNFSICRAELRCEEVPLSKTEIETALEGTHDERDFQTLSDDIDFRTFLHCSAETIRIAVADSLHEHGYI